MEMGDVPGAWLSNVGVVAIGRNEGARLGHCLASVPPGVRRIVYVDSGSVDGSVELAASKGAEVFALDMSSPFTAARARNAGIDRLLEMSPGVGFVFVIDGDCELRSGFLEAAVAVMNGDDRLAVVCGRRRERHPQSSIYDRLCDMEWNTPIGPADACGGDAVIRVSAFCEVGGYDVSLIAGEEPEICLRLRERGWGVRRIDHEMTWHEAGIKSFAQWWRRSVRAGHAYAELFARHHYWAREVSSVVVYALCVPLLVLFMALAISRAALGLSLVYLVLYLRAKYARIEAGDASSDARLYARFCVIAKFAHLAGMSQYLGNRLLGRRATIIEYKGSGGTPGRRGAKPVIT